MARRLTQKQETFCLKYFELGNASEAARIALYSPKTAAVIGRENLLKPQIQERIDELRQKAEDATIGTVQEREQILTEIYRGRMGDHLDEGHRIKQGEPLDSAAIQEVTTEDVLIGRGEHAKLATITKIKLLNPVPAIAEHNKMQKVYEDKTPIGIGTVVTNFIFLLPDGTRVHPSELQRQKEIASGDNNRETD